MNKKIGFTAGAFDIMHAGHMLMFREAKEQCDYLIVALQTDPTIDRAEKKKPVEAVWERYINLKGVRYIDEIIPYETEKQLYDLLLSLDPDIRIVGEDYRHKDFTGKEIATEIYYNSRKHNLSSTSLKERVSKAY